MKKNIILILILITGFFAFSQTVSVQKKKGINYLTITNDTNGKEIFSIKYSDFFWDACHYETKNYLYFITNDYHFMMVDKNTGLMENTGIITSGVFLISPDEKYLCVSRENPDLRYSKFLDQNYDFTTSVPVLYDLKTRKKIDIKEDYFFIQKNTGYDLTLYVDFDIKNNILNFKYNTEGVTCYKGYISLEDYSMHCTYRSVHVETEEKYKVVENLRLRRTSSKDSETLYIMKSDSVVEVLDYAKWEIIDNKKAHWVKVKVISGYDSRTNLPIPEGTEGWCFAGYLWNY